MEYTMLDDIQKEAMLEERIRNYEAQHFAASLDLDVANELSDENSTKEATSRKENLEAAIVLMRSKRTSK